MKVMLVLAMMLTSCGFKVIESGERGLKVKWGKLQGNVLEEGLHVYNPFTTDIALMDIKILKSNTNESMYTKDVQVATISTTITYSLDPGMVKPTYETYRTGWSHKILPQAVKASLKDEIGRWDAEVLIANQDKARGRIEASLRESVKDKGVLIQKFDFANIKFEPEFEAAVEAKVIAKQRATEAKNKTDQIREEAEQKRITAEAEAKSMEIRAQALQKNKGLVDYEAIKKWNGVLPHTIMGGGALPFINLKNEPRTASYVRR